MNIRRSVISYYPIAINLDARLAVIAGGGEVAERKVRGLLRVGAKITVVSPQATLYLRRLARQKRIRWIKREVQAQDVSGAGIVIAATSERKINKQVSLWAKKQGVLVNVVDRPSLSNFISPAVLRAAKATVSVHTNGKDPLFSKDLKNFLEEYWDVFLSYRHRL